MRPKDAKREWDGDKPFFHLIYNAEASHYHSWQEPNLATAHARARARARRGELVSLSCAQCSGRSGYP